MFGPSFNVIFGSNAQGKTNLLEAISLVSIGRSFRTQKFNEIIRDGASFFYIEAEIIRDGVSQKVQMTFDGTAKKLQLNANEYTTLSPLLGSFPLVLSTPEDMNLTTDAPATRRRFLNLHLAQSKPLYVHHFSRFWHAMKQRNLLLKSKQLKSIECWEHAMAESAEHISKERQSFIQKLQEPLQKEHYNLTQNEELAEIKLQSSYPSSAPVYLEALKKTRLKERDLGVTLHGPHRDDLLFFIQSKPAKFFASEGQKKTLITALRFAEWKHLSLQMDDKPFMGLDDFCGMLDLNRQKYLKDALQSMGQVFMTTPTQPIDFPSAHFLHVDQGKIL